MCCRRSPFIVGSLAAWAFLASPPAPAVETFEFKVVYAHVPGIEKVLAGDLDAAIAVLEARAKKADREYVLDEFATLCALYVVTGQLETAATTCNAAIEVDRSDAAYNNRGVLRAHKGDVSGALEDFARVRILPQDKERYVEELKRRNARLMASRNFDVATEYIERRKAKRKTGGVRGADIQAVNN